MRPLLDRILARDHAGIGEGGRTIALLHAARTARSIVLFHGLSASPMQFVQIAHGLHERGYNVLVPRLPRHGYADRMSGALATLRVEDLKETARISLEAAQSLGERVTVAGFSLGGLLTSWVAQNYEIERAVPIAPFLGIAFVPNRLRSALTRTAMRMPNVFPWWNPLRRERMMPEHGYPRYASHAIAQAMVLSQEVLDAATTEPFRAKRVMVVTNAHESAVNNGAVRALVTRWKRLRPDAIETYRFDHLPISHDIIEPLYRPAIVKKVYPILLELLDK